MLHRTELTNGLFSSHATSYKEMWLPHLRDPLCHHSLFFLIKSNSFFFNNNCPLWSKESEKGAILIALKGSNQIVICLINHVTRSEIYSKARSLNILYITFLMVMQLRNWTWGTMRHQKNHPQKRAWNVKEDESHSELRAAWFQC